MLQKSSREIYDDLVTSKANGNNLEAGKHAASYVTASADALYGKYKSKVENDISASFIRYEIDELNKVTGYLKSKHRNTNMEGQSGFTSTTGKMTNKISKADNSNLPTIEDKLNLINVMRENPRAFGTIPAQKEHEDDEKYIKKVANILITRSNQLDYLDEKDYDSEANFSHPDFSKMRDAISTMAEQFVELANGCDTETKEGAEKRSYYLKQAKQCYDMNFDYNYGITSIFQRFIFYVKQGLWGALSKKDAAGKVDIKQDFITLKSMAKTLENELIQQEYLAEEGKGALDGVLDPNNETKPNVMNSNATFIHDNQSHKENNDDKTTQHTTINNTTMDGDGETNDTDDHTYETPHK